MAMIWGMKAPPPLEDCNCPHKGERVNFMYGLGGMPMYHCGYCLRPTKPVSYIQATTAAEEPKPTDDPLKLAEDKVVAYLNTWTPLEILVAVKIWRANNPHLGSSIDELNRAIRKLLK